MPIDIKPILLLLFLSSISYGQEHSRSNLKNIHFTSFKGVIYDMPVLSIKVGRGTRISIKDFYDDSILDYDTICQVSLDHLNFPEASIDKKRFSCLDQKTNYAMLLEATMTIEQKGCYAFELSSDDGSRLWINDAELLNNDGGHGMRTKRDTSLFDPGTYKAKLWYFQGMPDKYGLILNTSSLGKEYTCTKKVVPVKEVIVLNNVLFSHDDYRLNSSGFKEIQRIVKAIQSKGIKKISIIGHTDQSGSKSYNLKLSEKRANAVKKALRRYPSLDAIQMEVVGKGSSELIDLRLSKKSRAKNRRVELVLYSN